MTITLSKIEADLLIRLMWDLLDVSDDETVRRDARAILRKLGVNNKRTRRAFTKLPISSILVDE